jgi:hypothetical protein
MLVYTGSVPPVTISSVSVLILPLRVTARTNKPHRLVSSPSHLVIPVVFLLFIRHPLSPVIVNLVDGHRRCRIVNFTRRVIMSVPHIIHNNNNNRVVVGLNPIIYLVLYDNTIIHRIVPKEINCGKYYETIQLL